MARRWLLGSQGTVSQVRPLVWSDHRAATGVAGLLAWLVSVEVGTSRRASRQAAGADLNGGEQVIDTATGTLFDAAALVAIAGGVVASLGSGKASIRSRRTSYLVGVCLLAGSGALSSSARQHLGRFHRNALTVHSDHVIVETGPYRRVRHPLYTATIGVFLGIGTVLGNWVSLGLAALPTMALVHRINIEEAMLLQRFGADYTRYRERTDRLVPGVW